MSLTNSASCTNTITKPGSYLAQEREKRGVSVEHIANKLNLRAQVLLHLEADEYEHLPQSVFVKGYIRAYCKHLDLTCGDDLVRSYTSLVPAEHKIERLMWQYSVPKHAETSERWLHWIIGMFVSAAVVASGMWWLENKPKEGFIPNQLVQGVTSEQAQAAAVQNEKNSVKVTDLSKMRNFLNSKTVEQNIDAPGDVE